MLLRQYARFSGPKYRASILDRSRLSFKHTEVNYDYNSQPITIHLRYKNVLTMALKYLLSRLWELLKHWDRSRNADDRLIFQSSTAATPRSLLCIDRSIMEVTLSNYRKIMKHTISKCKKLQVELLRMEPAVISKLYGNYDTESTQQSGNKVKEVRKRKRGRLYLLALWTASFIISHRSLCLVL